jgi:hypothetical protein
MQLVPLYITGNAMYQDRFWRAEYFEAVDKIRAACEEAGGGLTAASAAGELTTPFTHFK